MFIVSTIKEGNEFRCVVFKVDGDEFWGSCKTVEDVYECDDLRRLATHVANDYPDAAVLVHNPNPHTDYELAHGDALSLAEVIEAEFLCRPGREEAAAEWLRQLEVTGGQI